MNFVLSTLQHSVTRILLVGVLLFGAAVSTQAATLSVSPGTGVYQAGATFTARVIVNTQGEAINAADATLKFDTSQLSVISVSKGSIFNLWTQEPTFSNAAGTISFGGGATPPGFTGGSGTILNITFQVKAAGTGKVSFTSGSVLANDGRGTNVLTSMNGGSYTIQAQTSEPTPEVVVEYVAPANTPGAPQVTSATHRNDGWSKETTAVLEWSLPAGVTAVRTLLDESPSTIPTRVYDSPIRTLTLSDLPEGVSYFHIQFQNADGWGRVTHYRLAVDNSKPEELQLEIVTASSSSSTHAVAVAVKETVSTVERYLVKIDDAEPFEVRLESATGTIAVPILPPGYHTIVVEAFDAAGNSIIETISLTVAAFDKPVFTEYPTSLSTNVIPVIMGSTRPNAAVTITLTKVGATPLQYEVNADATGVFVFIPESKFTLGVYELVATAVDVNGEQSESSDTLRILVEEPGYLKIGSTVVSVLSVLIPTIALAGLLLFLLLFMWRSARTFRRAVDIESEEALAVLREEFGAIGSILDEHETILTASRKTGLTKLEKETFAAIRAKLQKAQVHVADEITDVKELSE